MESVTPTTQMKKILLIVSLAFVAASFASAQDYALEAFNYGLTHYGFFNPAGRSTGYSQPEGCNRTVEIRPDGMGNFYFYGSSGRQTGAVYTDGMGGYRINYFSFDY
jgi:hypothetical protein